MSRRPRSGTAARTDPWGIDPGYEDALGVWRRPPPETRSAILKAMGVDPAAPGPPDRGHVQVARWGRPMRLRGPADLTLEDGTLLSARTSLPGDLPIGYHELRPLDGGPAVQLIVTPGRCHLPEAERMWGWAVQLYALRSAMSWGLGDFRDLRRLARWSARELGAGFLLVNPLHAAAPNIPQQSSPYFPSSRRYRNPLYLCVEEIPGAGVIGPELDRLAEMARALNQDRRIDRDRVFQLKMEALGRLWSRVGADPAFDRYRAGQGAPLREFATFCALAEHHGSGWRRWPPEHRLPASGAVQEFVAARAERVRFHEWVQWLLDRQLATVAAELRVVQDLPIGVDPDGADAWAWQDVLADEVTVGAPPDEYNTRGQDWGLPPFVPYRLRARRYRPFIETIRATLRHAGGLRIDHVIGLFRLFWIPRGTAPAQGAYVRYPADELMAIVAVESQRAHAMVVGEDLGTVEARARAALAAHRILSYRLLWFETRPTARYPRLSLAAVTTHDLPTIAGLWSGSDLRAQRDLGLRPNEAGLRAIRSKFRRLVDLADGAELGEVIVRAHQVLARAPSIAVAATLEDALAVEERPNMPATGPSAWPSWSLALPLPLEALETHSLVRAVGEALRGPLPAAPPV